jgi:hypothetical protein
MTRRKLDDQTHFVPSRARVRHHTTVRLRAQVFHIVKYSRLGVEPFAIYLEKGRYSATSRQVQTRSSRSCVVCWGLRSCPANQAATPARCRVRTSEQLFHESLARKIFPNSGASSSRSGPTNRRSIWRSARGFQSAGHNTSSTANASRTRKPRSWSMRRCLINSNFSSGDGLGNHQPGSMTCGFASRRQPASGRARDRAICPAVARFTSGRV